MSFSHWSYSKFSAYRSVARRPTWVFVTICMCTAIFALARRRKFLPMDYAQLTGLTMSFGMVFRGTDYFISRLHRIIYTTGTACTILASKMMS